MKLSFVVPAHNEEAFLAQSLQAIISEIERSRCEAEIIVVDNASTDGTRDVAGSFPGVRVVEEPVKSLVRARAAGFEASTGTLVANIDADTVLPEGWIDRVLDAFARNPDLAAISGPYICYGVPLHERACSLFLRARICRLPPKSLRAPGRLDAPGRATSSSGETR
ncbi:glycosyltransferase family 2 protein [Mesorhizobium atlanticum]